MRKIREEAVAEGEGSFKNPESTETDYNAADKSGDQDQVEAVIAVEVEEEAFQTPKDPVKKKEKTYKAVEIVNKEVPVPVAVEIAE